MSELNSPPMLLDEDYGEALVHAVWLVKGDRRILVFGFIELFAVEQPPVDVINEQWVKSAGSKGFRLFFSRIRMIATEAVALYSNAISGKGLFLPVKGDSGEPALMELPRCLAEPRWPNLSLTMGAPYLPYGVQPRCHHLLPESIGSELRGVLSSDDDISWIEDRFFFSLADYDELIGSFHILAHNPLYRGMSVKLRRTDDGVESVAYKIELRHQQSLEGVTLYQIEKRLDDYAGFQARELTEKSFALPLSGVADEVEHVVYCKKRGMLDKSNPCGFMRQISFSLGLHSQKASIAVPGKGGAIDETYIVDKVSYDRNSVIGESEVPDAMRLYSSKKQVRKLKRQAEELGQQWFENEPIKARNFVRGLISKARERVWVIDPYFSTVDLFRFALAATSPAVEVVIATSAEHLQGDDSIAEHVEAGEVLMKNLEQFKNDYTFTVRVLNGSRSPIHDRFLVIDAAVWFVGNSLNSLGKRAGMMIKLPDPSQMLGRLEDIVKGNRSKELGAWVEDRRSNKQESCCEDS